MTELLIGCGRSRTKKIFLHENPGWTDLITVDNNPDVDPDLVHDLNTPLVMFPNDSFNEIHAYEVLEHTGTQGDYKFFFSQFSDFYRILKPDGCLFGTVPLVKSIWAWGDPSHSRVIPKESLMFLNQPFYENVNTTPMSDFRYIYKADFDIIHLKEEGECLQFVLKAIKPSRIQS